MGDLIKERPQFSPFVLHEITAKELEKYRDSPTQSILKTPTAVFPFGDDLHRSGKRLTFADSPGSREGSCDSSTSNRASNVRNGEGGRTPVIEVAVSPVKSIRVSPEAWRAHIVYQRTFIDFANETEKTDYTYSYLSPFHKREILPGITMRPNMSRPPLRSISSAPTTRCSTPVTSRKNTSAPLGSPFIKAISQRLGSWQIKKSRGSDEKERKFWWWLLLPLILVIGLWSLSGPTPVTVSSKKTALYSEQQVADLLGRLNAVEISMAEAKKLRSAHFRHMQQALLVDRAMTLSASRRCCLSVRTRQLYAFNKLWQENDAASRQQHAVEEQENFLNKLSEEVSQIRQNWTDQLNELRTAMAVLSHSQTDHMDIHRIVAKFLKRYDSDKIGKADFALESAGGNVLGIRCTQPWPGPEGQSFDPQVAIRRGVAPGECWAFQGEGHLIVQLSHAVNITGCSIEHIPATLHPHGRTSSAPKNFTLWGLKSEEDPSPHLFGAYIYDIGSDAETVQEFSIVYPAATLYNIVELVISSNHGHPYTCLYRLRIHGTLK